MRRGSGEDEEDGESKTATSPSSLGSRLDSFPSPSSSPSPSSEGESSPRGSRPATPDSTSDNYDEGGGGGGGGGGKGGAAVTTPLSSSPSSSPSKPVRNLTDDPLVKKWLDEKDSQTKERVEENKTRERHRRYTLGACYLLAMGICGIVLVALGSTLLDIAANCGTTATAVGLVFVTRGCGAILGAMSSAKLYEKVEGNRVICTTLFCLAMILAYMPWINHVWQLHLCFGLLGMCTAITDTGCQIMTRFVHGPYAGPWLGANTVSFGVSGAIVPVISYISDLLWVQYVILASLSLLGSIFLIFIGDAGVKKNKPGPPRGSLAIDFHWKEFKTEMIVANMVFWLIGGKVSGKWIVGLVLLQ